jgi:hypothetical protein
MALVNIIYAFTRNKNRLGYCAVPSYKLRKKSQRVKGEFLLMFSLLYSTLLHLPPLRIRCVGGRWDRTQDSCGYVIGYQTL